MDGLSQLSAKSSELTRASTKLNSSVPELVQGAKTLNEGGAKLAKNNATLKTSSGKLVKASKKMKKSVATVNQGVKKLDKGGKSLKKATNKLVSGVDKLDTASDKLKDGSKTLSKGVKKFNDKGVTKLNDAYEDNVKGLLDRVKAVCQVGKDYKSFSGAAAGMDGEVKFVIETEGIEKDD